jgi:hypothetical protein
MTNQPEINVFDQAPQIIHQLELLMLLSACGSVTRVEYAALPNLKPGIFGDLKDGGFDTLGKYLPDESTVKIDPDKCRKLDNEYGAELGSVELIVLVHELAHFVSHIGVGQPTMRSWVHFKTSKAEDLERVAQAFTYLWIRRRQDSNLMTVFAKMSEHSPRDYRQWEAELCKTEKFETAWGMATIDLWLTSSRITGPDWLMPPGDAKGILDI